MSVKVVHFMRRGGAEAFSIERLFSDLRAAMPGDIDVEVFTCRNFSTGVLPRLRDMWAARFRQGDVNHVTGDVHYLTFLLDPSRTLLTIHDLVMLRRLRGFSRFALWLLWYWLPVRRSRQVVVISESIRAELLAAVRCDPAKVTVIHNTVSDEFRHVPARFNTERPRILQVGTGWNKNVERAARALEGLDCRLVIVGRLTADQKETLHRLGTDYENHVGLSREKLLATYAACDMVIFASLYEGFGLPIIEAQATGRPVVTSNIHSMPEVAGGGACLVDPFDVQSISAGVRQVISDAAYREALVERGLENVKRFRSNLVAERYAEVYRRLAGAVE